MAGQRAADAFVLWLIDPAWFSNG